MRVQLIPLDGGAPIEIAKDLILVGRNEECDVRLNHKSVSKQHCVLVKTDGLLMLRDLGSTNGTRVNGQRVRRAALLPNDQLNIASISFKVTFSKDDRCTPKVNEFTQQIDGKDLQKLLHPERVSEKNDDSSIEDIAMPVIQNNALPDVIDEKKMNK